MGWVAGTTQTKTSANNKANEYAYLRTMDDEFRHMKAPACDWIRPLGMNNKGQIVGRFSVGGVVRAYVWSAKHGHVVLENSKLRSRAERINDQGVIVGTRVEGGQYRPCLWMPPSKPGQPYTMRTLSNPSDGRCASFGIDINAQGTVLVYTLKPFKREGKTHGAFKVARPYRWTPDQGYQPLPTPSVDHAMPVALSDAGRVLLVCWPRIDTRKYPNQQAVQHYLCGKGQPVRLPDYPGAERTDYIGMCGDGYIVGVARFNLSKQKIQTRIPQVKSFVISLKPRG